MTRTSMSSLTGLEFLSSCLESGYFFVFVAIGLQILYAFLADDGRGRRATVKRSHPPGPRGIPIFGYFPFLGKDVYRTLARLGDKYGDVVMVPVGNQKIVILNSLDVLQQAFVVSGDAFAFRPKALHNMRLVYDSSGLFCASDEKYKELKSFVVSATKDYGAGIVASETWIQKECESAADRIASFDEAAFDATQFSKRMSIKFMLSFLIGKNYDDDVDPKLRQICRLIVTLENFIERFHAIDVLPWLRFFPDWLNGIRQLRKDKSEFYGVLAGIIDEHERTFDVNRQRDFIDAFLAERNQRQEAGQFNDDIFNAKQLASTLTALLMFGYSTSVYIQRTLFEALATKPEVQRRIREEVDSVIGFHRSPSMVDKRSMPYTEATILEAQRFANPLPFGTVRSNAEPVIIGGYEIPKHSLVIGNYGKLNNDERHWAKPKEFCPDNFLDGSGNVVHPEHFMPFGTGNRNCPGQNLAKMEMFLFLATLIQQFTIRSPTEADRKPDGDQQNQNHIMYGLMPFHVVATTRVHFY